MQDFWKKIRGWWQIFTTLFIVFAVGSYWVYNQEALIPRVEALEVSTAKQKSTLERLDYNVQLIGRQVGVQPLAKPDGE